ncbi:MAG TPA: hypothetical protein VGF13_03845 [Verrucomicrobiae bacterium]|jgi:antitoxin (DNA-binding transcriptional repressor) of toxin-antitoxin stability system
MKATATELARETARLLSHAQHGKKVDIVKHGKTLATLQGVRTIKGKDLFRALDRLTPADRRAIKAGIEDGMKALRTR